MYIIVVILSFIIALNAINKIPLGNELGGLAQVMLSFIATAIILLVGYIVCYIVNKYGTANLPLKLIIYVLILGLVYYSTDNICVNKFEFPSTEETRTKNHVNEKDNTKRVQKIINKIELNLPDLAIVKNHKDEVTKEFKKILLKVDTSHTDLLNKTHDSIGQLLGLNHFPDKLKDSNEYKRTVNFVIDVGKTLNCRFIHYSPDQKYFLVYITFSYPAYDSLKFDNSSNCLVYLGHINNENISIYPFYGYPNYGDDFPNVEIAFNNVIRYLSNDYGEKYFEEALTSKNFWQSFAFQTHGLNGKSLFGFQLKYYQPFGTWTKTPVHTTIEERKPLLQISSL